MDDRRKREQDARWNKKRDDRAQAIPPPATQTDWKSERKDRWNERKRKDRDRHER